MKRRMKTFSWRDDLKLNAARCFSGTHATVRFIEETVVTSATCVKRVLTWARSKWTKDSRTCNEEEDEDTLVEEGLELERGTVFHKDTWHSEIFPRNIVTKRLPREACFDQGDCQVQKDVVTLSGEEDEDTLVEEGPQVERGTVFLRDTCHREIYYTNSGDKRVLCEACFDQGDVKVENVTVTSHEEEDEGILVEEGAAPM